VNRRLCVICEGQTEARFTVTCLQPHLLTLGILAYPAMLKTRPSRKGGGHVSVERVAKHIQLEYAHSDAQTTLLDYYGFRDVQGRTKAQLEQAILEQASRLIQNFDPRFIIPYIQIHEFEALLFSDIEQFKWVVDGWDEKKKTRLQAVRAAFASPEDIDDGPDTAPSKRILKIFNGGEYSKVEHGPLIAEAIGLSCIREHCRNFNAWLSRLEDLRDIP